ncbi:MAG: type II toxin-antitoxin system RelE/ParE family toxin [Desulfobulbaceae bacterium]|jgi:putative addiction module killer protein|nr:type II toxin-antitoxin system RelE/ParE family toxin [Desulfobulbaceae bacterium]
MRYEIKRTRIFDKWLSSLRDRQAVIAINKRFARLALGNFGDAKAIGRGVFELRFFIGPGYRVYYTIRHGQVILLLAGGDKSSQQKDIQQALAIVRALEE